MIYGLRITDDEYNTWVEAESTDESYIEMLAELHKEFNHVIDVMITERLGKFVEINYLDGIDYEHYM